MKEEKTQHKNYVRKKDDEAEEEDDYNDDDDDDEVSAERRVAVCKEMEIKNIKIFIKKNVEEEEKWKSKIPPSGMVELHSQI